MAGYILRRLLAMIPVLILLSVFVFLLVRLVPGDPATIILGQRATAENVAKLRESLKLNEPYPIQYVAFLGNLLQGDFGESMRRREPVLEILINRVPVTLFLAGYAVLLSVILSVPLAAAAALNRGKLLDQLIRLYTLLSLAMPAYWIGMMLLQLFAVKIKVFPVAGWGDDVPGHFYSLFLGAFSLALAISSILIRSLRNSLLETMDAEFVRTARAKGLGPLGVFTWHIARNSVLSTVTILGVNIAFLVGGATITETIFSIPGIGQLIVRAIFDRDYPVIQGITLVFGVLVLVINLITDIIYAALDPRVSYE